jgi:hypothetical protein
MKSKIKIALFLLLIIGSLSSCVSVQEYQKIYLNDEDMILGLRRIESFEINFESYREGALGANGGKVGGGCGCN